MIVIYLQNLFIVSDCLLDLILSFLHLSDIIVRLIKFRLDFKRPPIILNGLVKLQVVFVGCGNLEKRDLIIRCLFEQVEQFLHALVLRDYGEEAECRWMGQSSIVM